MPNVAKKTNPPASTGKNSGAPASIHVVDIPKVVIVDDAGRQYYLEDRGRGTYLLRPMP